MWWKDILELFFPDICQGCGTSLSGNEQLVCVACWHSLPRTNHSCSASNMVQERLTSRVPCLFAGSALYFHKESPLQYLLHALKYRKKQDLGIFLGRLMGHEWSRNKHLSLPDGLVPVPLSAKKLQSRGYNQSLLLAKGMSEVLKIPVWDNMVFRIKNTQTQTHMKVSERIENMQKAFEVKNPADFLNKHVLLIDDVFTTGATLESLASAIRQRNSVEISVFTLACTID